MTSFASAQTFCALVWEEMQRNRLRVVTFVGKQYPSMFDEPKKQ
jgi:hypothetical protein